MTDSVSRMAQLCRQRNETVLASDSFGEMDLDSFAMLQAQKVKKNRKTGALRSGEDAEKSAVSIARQLLGEAAASRLEDALKKKVICSADHLGSLYCSQFFQGDLLFALILEKLGERNPAVPILAAGQVELENSTYARGICAYSSRDEKRFLPFFPAKCSVQLASHASVVSSEMTERFRRRFVGELSEKQDFVEAGEDLPLRKTLDEICRELYETEDLQKARSFSDQTARIGKRLMDHLFPGEAPSFVYLEMETVVQPLLLAELSDESSLLHLLLYDSGMRDKLIRQKLPDGLSLGDLLFRAADEKGRKIMLSLTQDGLLTGRDWRKEPVCYGTKPDELASLIREKKVFPGVFTEVLLLFFERGITWMGGMFQASYLPMWQDALAAVLEEAGCEAQAEIIRAYDCTGYVCGPMYALYRGDGFATTAGPVELWRNPVSFERIRELVRQTSLWDAHLIGLSEMYFDLTRRDERESDWYRKIAEELFRAYPENVVADESK